MLFDEISKLEISKLEISKCYVIFHFYFFNVQNWDRQEGRDSCLKINKYFEISNFEISSNSFSYDMPATLIMKNLLVWNVSKWVWWPCKSGVIFSVYDCTAKASKKFSFYSWIVPYIFVISISMLAYDLSQWKILLMVNIQKLDNTIIALKQQLLGVILCFFMHLKWPFLLRLFA